MKLIAVLLLLISFSVILMLIHTNNQLKFNLEQQQQEIDASSKYIELLTEELLKNGSMSYNSDTQSDKMSELLSNYLEEKENDPTIPGSEDEDRQMTFIPDFIPIIGEYVISQRFKEKHQAVDLAASLGTQVVAAATGEIISIKQDKYFGNMLVMDHFNGYITIYAHLAKVLTEEGTIVKKGMIIGLVGNTGNSTGPHLHFEIIQNGETVDPEKIIDFNKQ